MGGYREDRPRLFSEAHSERMSSKRQIVTKEITVRYQDFILFFYNEGGQRLELAVEFEKLWTVHL